MIGHLFSHVARHLISHALAPTHQPRRQRTVAAPAVSLFAITNALSGSKLPPPLPASAMVRTVRAVRPRRAKRVQVQLVRGWEC
jgi:hypothetical protein